MRWLSDKCRDLQTKGLYIMAALLFTETHIQLSKPRQHFETLSHKLGDYMHILMLGGYICLEEGA